MAVVHVNNLVRSGLTFLLLVLQLSCTFAVPPQDGTEDGSGFFGRRSLLEKEESMLNVSGGRDTQMEVPSLGTTGRSLRTLEVLVGAAKQAASTTAEPAKVPATQSLTAAVTIEARAILPKSVARSQAPERLPAGVQTPASTRFRATESKKSGTKKDRGVDPCAGVTCGPNSKCGADSTGKLWCYCNQGYVVVNNQCTLNDPCAGVTCGANSKCGADSSGKLWCYCNQGYTVVNGQCTLQDKCAGVTCGANSKCGVDSSGKVWCYCNQGYTVVNNQCALKDPCAGVTCGANSKCGVDSSGKVWCYCNQGYTVINNQCALKDVCSGVNCPANSACKNNNGKATCYCNQGYTVVNNQCVLPGVCSGVNCPANSACKNNNGKATCYCNQGYVVQNNQCVLSGGGGGSGGHDDWLSGHNSARAAVGVGPLTWSDSVASVAQRWAIQLASQNCAMVHGDHANLGQNLAWSSGSMSPQSAVSMWVNERADYSYGSNSCGAGKVCGHYTQVVWRNTNQVGCASIRCSTGGTIIVCDYSPAGNWVGQKPY